MASQEAALFHRFPELKGGLPRVPFVQAPTPVEPLPMEGVPEGLLWVKRDDQSCALYGGNKPRKLEFVLGRALARGARSLVTTGGLGTNHGLATTILGREVGLTTTLVLLDQPLTEGVRESLLLYAAYGARLVYGRNIPGTACQVARVLATDTLRGRRPFLVSTGGSSPAGNVGFVSAAFELAEQVRAGALPEPSEIHVAVGTGGTFSGLVLGLRLAGLASRVVGVLVTDILPPSSTRLLGAARAIWSLMHRTDPTLPEVKLCPEDFPLVHDQLGAGYGSPTEAGRLAVEAVAGTLRLETTYTGKCMAAIRVRFARGDLTGPVLFWNTYSGVDVRARAPRPPDASLLPPRFRRILASPA